MKRWTGTLILVLTAVACGGGDGSDDEGSELRDRAARNEALTDAQIASLAALINGTERAAAKAVQPKLVAPAVRGYAGMLMADHARLMEALPDLPGPSEPPPQAETLRAVFHSQSAMLATLPAGYPFDATFAAIQVVDHVMAVDSLRRWHGVARGPELRRALAAALPIMESHLERARALYSSLDQRVDLGRPGPQDTVPPSTAPGPATVPADTAGEAAEGAEEAGRREGSPPE